MEGKLIFIVNEKGTDGTVFTININQKSIGKVSKNNNYLEFDTPDLNKLDITIENDTCKKQISVTLSEAKPQQTIEIETTLENKRYKLYMAFAIIYVLVIFVSYFILAKGLYLLLIALVLLIPLVIAKLLGSNSKTDEFSLKIY